MSKLLFLFAIVFISILFSGCGSGSDTPTRTASNANTAANSAMSANAVAPGIPANVTMANNASDVPAAGPIDMANRRKLGNATGPIPPPTRTAGPENSEFDTTMDKQGNFIEERFFKNNPVLVKAVKTLYGPNNSEVQVFLKNGKVVKVPGAKVDVLSRIPVATLLDLAGVKPPPLPPSSRQTTKENPLKPAQ